MRGGQAFRGWRGLVLLAMVAGAHAASGGGALAADDGPGLLDSVLEALNVKTAIGPTPGFVEATHPDPSTLRFIPTGAPHPKRADKVKSADDIEAAKASLDAARDAQVKPRRKAVTKSLKARQAATGH